MWWQMMKRRSGLLISALVVLFGLLVVFNVPYKNWLELKLKHDLSLLGLGGVDFSVDEVNLRGITLKDVTLGGQTLESLVLGYTPLEIMQGNFRKLEARNMALRQGQMRLGLSDVTMAINPDAENKKWEGPWEVKAITLSGLPVDVPTLAGSGVLAREGGLIDFEGEVASADASFKMVFALVYSAEDKTKSVLTIEQLTLPWNGGRLSVANVEVPLFADTPITFSLQVKKVSLNMVMAGATGNKATATGTISGAVPVTIMRDGNFSLQAGTLQSDGTGTLTLSPDLVPGEGEQMQMVRDVLKDFHYAVFTMALENADAKKLSILLSLKGYNPDVYNGRAIHLNVHLTGNVIELLTQSVMMLRDPQQLMEQESHE